MVRPFLPVPSGYGLTLGARYRSVMSVLLVVQYSPDVLCNEHVVYVNHVYF